MVVEEEEEEWGVGGLSTAKQRKMSTVDLRISSHPPGEASRTRATHSMAPDCRRRRRRSRAACDATRCHVHACVLLLRPSHPTVAKASLQEGGGRQEGRWGGGHEEEGGKTFRRNRAAFSPGPVGLEEES